MNEDTRVFSSYREATAAAKELATQKGIAVKTFRIDDGWQIKTCSQQKSTTRPPIGNPAFWIEVDNIDEVETL